MSVESEIIDARVGEPHVTPEQIADVNIGTYGPDDCVLPTGNRLKAELITNNSVRIFDGVMVYGGLRDAIPINKYYDMTIDNGAQGKNRNDIIVRRYMKEEGLRGKARSEFAVVKGTATTGNALDPVIEFTDIRAGALVHTMPLHRVRIKGLNIVAVEQLFTVTPTIPDLLSRIENLQGQADALVPDLLSRITNLQSQATALNNKCAIFGGTKIVNISPANSMFGFMTYEEVNRIIGKNYSKDKMSYNVYFQAMNGDVYGNNAKIDAVCYNADSGMFNLYFDQSTSGAFRVTYLIYDFGAVIS